MKDLLMQKERFSIFSEKQIEVIKDIVRFGSWGDDDINFGSNKETNYAYGFFTNLSGKGKYNRKELSGICSGISKTIKKNNSELITMISDFWGDGSGDMMFFNFELLETDSQEFCEFIAAL